MRSAQSKIEVLYFAGCPNYEPTVKLVREVVRELGLDACVQEVPVETSEAALRLRFLGSPSIRVNGQDIETAARERSDFALCCRIYGSAGVPPKALLIDALREAR